MARPDSLAQLATWYPGGGTIGYAFARQGVRDGMYVATRDQRLRQADDLVASAQQQLKDAKSARDVIRLERLQDE